MTDDSPTHITAHIGIIRNALNTQLLAHQSAPQNAKRRMSIKRLESALKSIDALDCAYGSKGAM